MPTSMPPLQIHPPRMPDMKRNIALAGKTVFSKGMNVTYDDKGYAVKAVNCDSKYFKGTMQSVRAPSIDAVLSAGNRVSNTGSDKDLEYFSDYDLQHVEEWRRQVEAGVITAQQAYAYLEELRGMYGYSCGPDGKEFVELEFNKRPGEVYAEESAERSGSTVALAQPVAAGEETARTESGETGAVAVLAPPVSAQEEAAPAIALAQPVTAEDETQRLQGLLQESLRRQQDTRALQAELNDLRADKMLRAMGERERDELFGTLFEENEESEEDQQSG